jgi:hypothetical protein
MHRRCTYPSQENYPRYGGKGIRVCERWNSFENFLEDMGEKPPGMSIDRYPDRNGDYDPNNCRWATSKQQQHNKDGAFWIEFRGETRHVEEWAEITGIDPRNITYRIRRGWTPEEALTLPDDGSNHAGRPSLRAENQERDAARYAKILSLRREGRTMDQIGRIFGLTRVRIGQILQGR